MARVSDKLPRLLDAEEVAHYLGLHQVTVSRFARQGKLPGFKVGREWRFRAADIKAWVEAQPKTTGSVAVRHRALRERVLKGAGGAGFSYQELARLVEEAAGTRRGKRTSSGE